MTQDTIIDLAQGVFQNQLRAIRAQIPGCIEGTDPIHLHDLRVANRRIRAALSEFRSLLPEDDFQRAQKDFRWMHQITGEVRDYDILLGRFPEYLKELPKHWRPHLAHTQDLLETRRDTAQQALREILSSNQPTDILEHWYRALDSGILISDSLAVGSVKEYGCKMIIKRYRKVRKEGLIITKKTPAEKYHDYRITIKRLRYLMEFLHPAIDSEDYSQLRIGLKAVQDAFGAYQDADVQREHLLTIALELHQSGTTGETILALGQVLGIIEKNLRRSKKECLRQTRWLVGDATARSFQSCFQYPVE